MLLPDQILGSYRTVRLLGSGGLGAVWEAVRIDDPNSRVAIKTLHKEFSEHPEISARFRREASVSEQLSHPNIVAAIEYGITDTLPPMAYMVMDLVSGFSLRQFMRRNGDRLPEKTVLQIFTQIADALNFAHGKGVVHRDLKPGNVMVAEPDKDKPQVDGQAPEIKILDFGIAKAIGPLYTDIQTADYKNIMGTFEYMSPEQFATPSQVTGHSDVYSLGIMIYFCLIGRSPFYVTEGLSSMQLAAEYYKLHTSAPPPRLPNIFSPVLADLVDAMLAKNPAARPSMRQVWQTLRDLLSLIERRELPTQVGAPGSSPTQPLPAQDGPQTAVTIAMTPSQQMAIRREYLLYGAAGVALLWALIASLLLLLR